MGVGFVSLSIGGFDVDELVGPLDFVVGVVEDVAVGEDFPCEVEGSVYGVPFVEFEGVFGPIAPFRAIGSFDDELFEVVSILVDPVVFEVEARADFSCGAVGEPSRVFPEIEFFVFPFVFFWLDVRVHVGCFWPVDECDAKFFWDVYPVGHVEGVAYEVNAADEVVEEEAPAP